MAELEQLCILARMYKGQACAGVVEKAISHPKIFVFGELLSESSVQSLRGSEYEQALNTLELFAYGTYQDYLADSSLYLELTPEQSNRLKLLSLITLASRSKILSYTDLMRDLSLSNEREVERLVVDAIYSNVMKGRLDQKMRCVFVQGAASRDVRPEELADIISQLSAWRSTCTFLIDSYEKSSSAIVQSREVGREQLRTVQESATALVRHIKCSPDDDYGRDAETDIAAGYRNRAKRSRGVGAAGMGMGLGSSSMRFSSGGPLR